MVEQCADGRAAVVLVEVRRHGRRSLTLEVEALLKCNPLREFTLRDVRACIEGAPGYAEINSVLHKLVYDKRRALIGRAHNGVREVNTYRWALPGGAP